MYHWFWYTIFTGNGEGIIMSEDSVWLFSLWWLLHVKRSMWLLRQLPSSQFQVQNSRLMKWSLVGLWTQYNHHKSLLGQNSICYLPHIHSYFIKELWWYFRFSHINVNTYPVSNNSQNVWASPFSSSYLIKTIWERNHYYVPMW